jgi:hypothetical protein
MRLIAAVALSLCIAPSATAASISGRVLAKRAPLVGATVTATGDALPQPRETITDARGRYWIAALPPGTYDLTFTRAGHQTVIRRVEVHWSETTRLDASLEPSEDEETVTMTATPESLLEAPVAIWSIDREVFDVLPVQRSVTTLVSLGPFGTTATTGDALPLEAVRAVAQPITGEPLIAMITRSGSEPTGSALATFARSHVSFESAAGAPVVAERLWLFAAAAKEQDHDALFFGKATAAPSPQDTVIAWAANDRWSAEWLRFSTLIGFAANIADDRRWSAAAFAFARGHELTFGAQQSPCVSEHALAPTELIDCGLTTRGRAVSGFAADRYVIDPHWTVSGGLRFEDDRLRPRAGASYDIGGDGQQHIAASVGRYRGDVTEAALMYGRQLGTNGYARATALSRDGDELLVLDGLYRWLFFTFGGNVEIGDRSRGSAWMTIAPPAVTHAIAISILERHRGAFAATDLAVQYAVAGKRLLPFVKGELTNALGVDEDQPRTWSVTIGLRR